MNIIVLFASLTEMPEKACIRYWHLMTMATCVMLPSDQLIFSYLILHLKRYSVQGNTDIGRYALFCIKVNKCVVGFSLENLQSICFLS